MIARQARLAACFHRFKLDHVDAGFGAYADPAYLAQLRDIRQQCLQWAGL
jgi:hypothetical protein